MEAFYNAVLARRAAEGRHRTLPGRPAGVDFSSNDYLGFARSPRLRTALDARLLRAGPDLSGSTGSRLISGDHSVFAELEARAARFHGFGSALFFGSGYAANVGLMSVVAGRRDTVLYDALVHASVRDGVRLGAYRSHSFRHNDPDDLEAKLARASGDVVVAVEALYSMDGDAAPLSDIAAVCRRRGARLVVDEAHSAGVWGERGEGAAPAAVPDDVLLAAVVTYGKAFGAHGACVLGSPVLKEYLVNVSRPFIYSTAPPPHAGHAVLAAYDLLESGCPERGSLGDVVSSFHRTFRSDRVVAPGSHIVAVSAPGNENVTALEEDARAAGFVVKAVKSPTVPLGEERVRITLRADVSPDDVLALAGFLAGVG